MRATLVSLSPTQAATDAARPALTPELLAATGARYSRSNEGLEAILSKIDPSNPDKSVDSIFRFIDYGHASVADMVPVAIFMDGISLWLAYHLWSLCPLAGGQESSTRYIRLSSDNLPDPGDIGIPIESQGQWRDAMNSALGAYEQAVAFWEDYAAKHPGATRVPSSLLDDDSDKAQKTVARMKRNFAFDRARYFLPAALQTNVMMIQSARAWVALCQQLLSHPLPEPRKLGVLIRDELALVTPRLIKHATAQPAFEKALKDEEANQQEITDCFDVTSSMTEAEARPILRVLHWHDPQELHHVVRADKDADKRFALDLEFHDNRYGHFGSALQMTGVCFGWAGVALAELRDLNRHRTGSKFVSWNPVGFYGAKDQAPDDEQLAPLVQIGERLTLQAAQTQAQSGGVYWFLLGAQFPFQHTTTADKFIYEAELRTGVGAHYRYAKHLHDVLELWYERFPSTRGLILEGSAEPE